MTVNCGLYFCICVFLHGVAEPNHSCQQCHLPRIKLSDKRDPGHLDLERRRRVTDRRRVFVPTFPPDWDLIRLLLLFLGRCQPITGCPPPKTPALPSIMSTNTKTNLQKIWIGFNTNTQQKKTQTKRWVSKLAFIWMFANSGEPGLQHV